MSEKEQEAAKAAAIAVLDEAAKRADAEADHHTKAAESHATAARAWQAVAVAARSMKWPEPTR